MIEATNTIAITTYSAPLPDLSIPSFGYTSIVFRGIILYLNQIYGKCLIYQNNIYFMIVLKFLKTFESFENKEYTDAQKNKAHDLFIELFDNYLRTVSPKTYPMIYHCTDIKHYDSIRRNGLDKKRNYFLDNDNGNFKYGFGDNDEEVPGIACGLITSYISDVNIW